MKKKFFKTFFPRFKIKKLKRSSQPDLTEISCNSSVATTESLAESTTDSLSDGSECFKNDPELKRQFQTKVDQDVAVFLEVAKRLPISSLKFILQNSVKSQNFPGCYDLPPTPVQAKPLRKVKHFRFALVSGDAVRTVVHTIPRYDEDCLQSLWWNEKEARKIRKDAQFAVDSFRMCVPQLPTSIKILAESYKDDTPRRRSTVERHMKRLTTKDPIYSAARGLECHIVDFLHETKKNNSKAVLNEQNQCRDLPYEEACESIREASLSTSIASRTLAIKFGECDHINGLTASMSKWEAEEE